MRFVLHYEHYTESTIPAGGYRPVRWTLTVRRAVTFVWGLGSSPSKNSKSVKTFYGSLGALSFSVKSSISLLNHGESGSVDVQYTGASGARSGRTGRVG